MSRGERGYSERGLVVLVLGLLADEEHHGSEKVLFSSGLRSSKVSSPVLELDKRGWKTHDKSIGSDLESLLNVPGTFGNDTELLE